MYNSAFNTGKQSRRGIASFISDDRTCGSAFPIFHKLYGSIKANDGITLDIEPGKILGILGENGAGKSTLMKILAGFTEKTSGGIEVDGTEVHYNTPAQAQFIGIGMLYQDPPRFYFHDRY